MYDTPKLRLKGRAGLVQDVKAGYISWQKDYAKDLELLNQGAEEIKGSKNTFLYMLSKIRTYKLLWRLLTTAANFVAVAVILYKISGIFWMLSKFGTMSYMVTKSQLASGLLTISAPAFAYKILKLIESAFLKRKVNIDKFDSISKTSTQFPKSTSSYYSKEKCYEQDLGTKIRRLEMRIAHLEREAGIFQQIKNIPKTLIDRFSRLGDDLSSYFKINPKNARERRQVAANALERTTG